MRRVALWFAILTATMMESVAARPDGAVWEAADPASPTSCSSCHFDHEAIQASSALQLEGLPDTAKPGKTYDLTLRLDLRQAAVAGFVVIAHMDAQSAGEFETSADSVETQDAGLRSTKALPASEIIQVPFRWTAPSKIDGAIRFFIAANAGNDDVSPFGDEIHYREYSVPAK